MTVSGLLQTLGAIIPVCQLKTSLLNSISYSAEHVRAGDGGETEHPPSKQHYLSNAELIDLAATALFPLQSLQHVKEGQNQSWG